MAGQSNHDSLDKFPKTFVARKIKTNIAGNRFKRIEQDMKRFRKKIVDKFNTSVKYDIRVTHELLPELTEDEQKEFYNIMKTDLKNRGFTVRGTITGGPRQRVITFIIFTNKPKSSEIHRVLKEYEEQKVVVSHNFGNATATDNATADDENIVVTTTTSDATSDATTYGEIVDDLITKQVEGSSEGRALPVGSGPTQVASKGHGPSKDDPKGNHNRHSAVTTITKVKKNESIELKKNQATICIGENESDRNTPESNNLDINFIMKKLSNVKYDKRK